MLMIGKSTYTEADGLADIKALGKETLSKEDFEKLIMPPVKLRLVKADPASLQFHRIFQDADVDKSGYLTVDELDFVLQKHSETKVSKTELLRIFQEFDTDGDKKLSI